MPDFLGKNLTLIGAIYSRYFENKPIVLGKTTNEYCSYLFAPWHCSSTKIVKYPQTQLQSTYATGPRRLYSTRSFRSTGLNFRLSWPAMASIYQSTSQKNSTSS